MAAVLTSEVETAHYLKKQDIKIARVYTFLKLHKFYGALLQQMSTLCSTIFSK
jgi:hypothetical protein